MTPTQVLVADPLKIFRAGVRNLLRRESDFEVIEAATLDEIRDLDAAPELALVDVDLPPRGAIEAVLWLNEHRECDVIVWGLAPDRDQVFDAIRAGARGYLHKEISRSGLVRALHGVLHGEAPLARDLVAQLVDALHGVEERDRAKARLGLLSPRENQVLDLIANGAPTRQIAAALAISEFTVKRHVQNILSKLDLRSRTAAAAFYRQAAGVPAGVPMEWV